MMADHTDVGAWYAHPMYARYWQYYKQASNWHQRHKRAYLKAMEACNAPPLFPMHPCSGWQADNNSDTEEESSDDDPIECDVSHVDISEELRQYFAQTEQHRQELKQMQADEQDSYVLADQDLHRVSWKSVLPPSERPGEMRTVEMKKLYGKDAARIQGMETAMRLTFDRNCDRKQPKYWPVIPLNL